MTQVDMTAILVEGFIAMISDAVNYNLLRIQLLCVASLVMMIHLMFRSSRCLQRALSIAKAVRSSVRGAAPRVEIEADQELP